MKTPFRFLLAFLICAVCACGQPDKLPSETGAIRQVLLTQQDAWNRGDIEGFMQGYHASDSLLFVSRKGLSYGWKQVLANYKKGYPDKHAMGTLTFGFNEIQQLSEDKALVIGSWKLSGLEKETGGYFSLVLQKFTDGWKIIIDHTS